MHGLLTSTNVEKHFAVSSFAISDESNQPNLTKRPETSIWALFCISYANKLCRTWAIPTPNRLDCLGISKYSIWRHPDVPNSWKWPKTKLRHRLHSWWCPFWSSSPLQWPKKLFSALWPVLPARYHDCLSYYV